MEVNETYICTPVCNKAAACLLFPEQMAKILGFILAFIVANNLLLGDDRRYWVEHEIIENNIRNIQVDFGQIGTDVKVPLKMSHKTLRGTEEDIDC